MAAPPEDGCAWANAVRIRRPSYPDAKSVSRHDRRYVVLHQVLRSGRRLLDPPEIRMYRVIRHDYCFGPNLMFAAHVAPRCEKRPLGSRKYADSLADSLPHRQLERAPDGSASVRQRTDFVGRLSKLPYGWPDPFSTARPLPAHVIRSSHEMNKDQVKGRVKEVEGMIKEVVASSWATRSLNKRARLKSYGRGASSGGDIKQSVKDAVKGA